MSSWETDIWFQEWHLRKYFKLRSGEEEVGEMMEMWELNITVNCWYFYLRHRHNVDPSLKCRQTVNISDHCVSWLTDVVWNIFRFWWWNIDQWSGVVTSIITEETQRQLVSGDLLFYISEKLLTSCTVQLNAINSSNERIIVVIVKTKLCVTVLLRPWDISWDWN